MQCSEGAITSYLSIPLFSSLSLSLFGEHMPSCTARASILPLYICRTHSSYLLRACSHGAPVAMAPISHPQPKHRSCSDTVLHVHRRTGEVHGCQGHAEPDRTPVELAFSFCSASLPYCLPGLEGIILAQRPSRPLLLYGTVLREREMASLSD